MKREPDTVWAWIATSAMLACLVLFFVSEARGKPLPRWHPCQTIDIQGGCYCKRSNRIIYIVEWTTRVNQLAEYLEGCDRRRLKRRPEHYQTMARNLLLMEQANKPAYPYLHMQRGPVKPF